jgi:uncharacterized protein (DUF2336 family)
MAPRFLVWAQRADPADRAAAASALARAYLYTDLTGAERHECSVAMAALLDDRHVEVRRALAEAIAASRRAPRALVVALANDRSEIAAPLLARSPLLTDAELVDAVAAGDGVAQCALARRPSLGPGPVGALAEVGTRDAVLALISNPDAALGHGTLRRLIDRFGDDADIRQALASRPDAPAAFKAEIAIADAGPPQGFPEGAAQARAARDAALAAIARSCPENELSGLVQALRRRRALTMALLLRSLAGGERAFFVASLAELSNLPHARAAGFVGHPGGAGFAAAARKAGFPNHSLPVFRAALEAISRLGPAKAQGLKADIVGAVIRACEIRGDPALAPFLALLWRFAAEAARADARNISQIVAATPALPPNLDFSPANDYTAEPELLAPVVDDRRVTLVELPADLIRALDAHPYDQVAA